MTGGKAREDVYRNIENLQREKMYFIYPTIIPPSHIRLHLFSMWPPAIDIATIHARLRRSVDGQLDGPQVQVTVYGRRVSLEITVYLRDSSNRPPSGPRGDMPVMQQPCTPNSKAKILFYTVDHYHWQKIILPARTPPESLVSS